MNALAQAVGRLARFLEERRLPYMIIGGVANLIWGEPRSTLDVDASVLVEAHRWPSLIKELRAHFHLLPRRPIAFLHETHVLPVETDEGVRIDLLWARLPYEHKAIARASVEEIAGHRVRVCRPEDLIIHKMLSDRPKDREDIRAVVREQGPRLDRAYLLRTVQALERALDRSDLLLFLRACFEARTRRRRRT